MDKIKKYNKVVLINFASVVLMLVSCNDFLDILPDKRAELDNEEKIAQMLVSAYPTLLPTMAFEMMSDNVADNGPQYSDYNNPQLSGV